MNKEPTLIDYPYVLVRFACHHCPRKGRIKLARLADKFGADASLEEVLDNVSADCHLSRGPRPGRKVRKYTLYCGIYLPDWASRPRPPDMPGAKSHLEVVDDEAAA